jgi:outer membrane protein TolC
VDAQGVLLLSPARTFASGADIHSQVLLPSLHDPEYRPGALAPEMPVTLTGNRRERQDQAEAYHARAGAVADKTRNLIGLEAEDSYLRWKQYDDEEPSLDAAADQLEAYSKSMSDKFNPEVAGYPTVDDVLNAGLKGVQARLDANQIKFRRLAALANLERVTGGGFDAGLEAAPAAPAKPKP